MLAHPHPPLRSSILWNAISAIYLTYGLVLKKKKPTHSSHIIGSSNKLYIYTIMWIISLMSSFSNAVRGDSAMFKCSSNYMKFAWKRSIVSGQLTILTV